VANAPTHIHVAPVSLSLLGSGHDSFGEAGEVEEASEIISRLSQLGMPVLICGGQYDGVAPVANQEALHQQIATSRVALFEGGHLFFAQDPRAFEDIIVFLNDGNGLRGTEA